MFNSTIVLRLQHVRTLYDYWNMFLINQIPVLQQQRRRQLQIRWPSCKKMNDMGLFCDNKT